MACEVLDYRIFHPGIIEGYYCLVSIKRVFYRASQIKFSISFDKGLKESLHRRQ